MIARVGVALVLASMAGCVRDASAQSSPPPTRVDAGLSRAEVHAPPNALCLPVVSDECGCVYDCGIGWIAADSGRAYEVHHRFWDRGRSVMHASASPWCVGRECTRAFHVDVVCDGVCAPRAADATCHFEGDVCTSGRVR